MPRSRMWSSIITRHIGDLQVTKDGALAETPGIYDFGGTVTDDIVYNVSIKWLVRQVIPSWAVSFGGDEDEVTEGVAIADNGDIVVAGYTSSFGSAMHEVMVFRTDFNGHLRWAKVYSNDNPNTSNRVYSIELADNGDIVAVGYTIDYGTSESDMLVLRVGQDGTLKWVKTYNGFTRQANDVVIGSNGDIIVVGYYYDSEASIDDMAVVRLDQDGSVLWAKRYDAGGVENAYGVALAGNGDIIVVGTITLRLDSSGNVIWARSLGGDKVAVADNGDVIVVGTSGNDIIVTKLDQNGNLKWAKTYGGPDTELIGNVAIDNDGNIIVVGSTYSFGQGALDALVIKLDSNGNVLWAKTYGGADSDFAYSVRVLNDNSIIVVGRTNSYGVSGSYDALVIKLGKDGNLESDAPRSGEASLTVNDITESTSLTSPSIVVNAVSPTVGSISITEISPEVVVTRL